MKRWSAAVIGLGAIGMGYDLRSRGSGKVLTHASAFSAHPRFSLCAGIDPDPRRRAAFTSAYGIPAFPDLPAMSRRIKPEVFAIAVPTALHYPVFMAVLEQDPAAIVCEKPMGSSLHDARRMNTAAKRKGICLCVNYIRRFDPGVLKLKKIIDSGAVGDIYKIFALYGKGIYNNCSHYIDLVRFLVPGAQFRVKSALRGRRWAGKDPEPDFAIDNGSCRAFFAAAREENFSTGTLSFIGANGVIEYANAGARIDVRRVRNDPVFKGYRLLGESPLRVSNGMDRYQYHVVDSLSKCLIKGSEPVSNGDTAIETLKIITDVIERSS